MLNFKDNSFGGIIVLISSLLIIANLFLEKNLIYSDNFIIFLLALAFIIIAISSFSWLKNKFTFESDNVLRNTGNIPFRKMSVASIYFSSYFSISILILFTLVHPVASYSNYIFGLILLLVTFNNGIILAQFNALFKQQERPNAYIFKFLNKKIGELSNNFETTFSLKVISFIGIFILPFVALFFLTTDVNISYFLVSIFLGNIIACYWVGYGLYKIFLWIWGVQSANINDSQVKHQRSTLVTLGKNLKYNEGKSVLFGFIFLLFSFLIFLLLVTKLFLPDFTITNTLLLIVLFCYTLFLYVIILRITGKRTQSQPWYSIFFTMYSFSIPFYMIFSVFFLFKSVDTPIINTTLRNLPLINNLIIISMCISIILTFIINNKYLTRNMWKDPYESNQLLSSLKTSLYEPSVFHLNLIQKLSNVLDDRETLIKLATSYQLILESTERKSNNDLIEGLFQFIINQLPISSDDEIFQLLFDLANNLIDIYPVYASKLYKTAIDLLKNGNSMVKRESLNILGHILQINPEKSFVNEIYTEIEKTYSMTEEKLKRLIIDALLFFIRNFPEYSSKIKNLLIEKLEYETFGVATSIYSVLDEIYQNTNDLSIFTLTQTTLESLNSPAKLGAINFLKRNMPIDTNERKKFIDLFLENLKDIDNAIGVRTNIIYAINELVKNDKSTINLLSIIKAYKNDSDPDVKSAIIQTFTDQYLLKNLLLNDLNEIYTSGIEETDYVVRLVVLQSIKLIKEKQNKIDIQLLKILDKAKTDDSQIIRNEVNEILRL